MLTTELQLCSVARDVPREESIRRWADAAFTAASQGDAEVTIRVVDREEGAALNRTFRNGERATNVLSFDYSDDPHVPSGLLGDIVICAPVVSEEATRQEKDAAAHWAHMVVHGVLHLCGYDHVQDEDAAAMEALEARILSRLGFPDPYG